MTLTRYRELGRLSQTATIMDLDKDRGGETNLTLERLDALEEQLKEIREELTSKAAQEAEVAANAPVDLTKIPEVREAAQEFAAAVARALGQPVPNRLAEGEGLPVVMLPPEIMQYGGIGIGVLVAPKPE